MPWDRVDHVEANLVIHLYRAANYHLQLIMLPPDSSTEDTASFNSASDTSTDDTASFHSASEDLNITLEILKV